MSIRMKAIFSWILYPEFPIQIIPGQHPEEAFLTILSILSDMPYNPHQQFLPFPCKCDLTDHEHPPLPHAPLQRDWGLQMYRLRDACAQTGWTPTRCCRAEQPTEKITYCCKGTAILSSVVHKCFPAEITKVMSSHEIKPN